MINADPFAREALIKHLDIQEWDPLFGQLSKYKLNQAIISVRFSLRLCGN